MRRQGQFIVNGVKDITNIYKDINCLKDYILNGYRMSDTPGVKKWSRGHGLSRIYYNSTALIEIQAYGALQGRLKSFANTFYF